MSAEEDTELRDLVAQTLEANGVLGKIRVNFMSVTVTVIMVMPVVQNLLKSLGLVFDLFC